MVRYLCGKLPVRRILRNDALWSWQQLTTVYFPVRQFLSSLNSDSQQLVLFHAVRTGFSWHGDMTMQVEVRISLIPLRRQIIHISLKQCIPDAYHIWHLACPVRQALLSPLILGMNTSYEFNNFFLQNHSKRNWWESLLYIYIYNGDFQGKRANNRLLNE